MTLRRRVLDLACLLCGHPLDIQLLREDAYSCECGRRKRTGTVAERWANGELRHLRWRLRA